jgi:diguanylate cyclase (GGDEF)-like protein
MLDIDKFKSINDTYGHPAGDGVIVSVAKTAMSAIRHIRPAGW